MGHMNAQGVVVTVSGFTAEVLGVVPLDLTRPDIDVTHLATEKFKAFEPGDLVDGGNVVVRIAYFPSEVPPIRDAVAEATIAMPDSGESVLTFDAYCNKFAVGDMTEDSRVEATMSLKVAGAVKLDGTIIGD